MQYVTDAFARVATLVDFWLSVFGKLCSRLGELDIDPAAKLIPFLETGIFNADGDCRAEN